MLLDDQLRKVKSEPGSDPREFLLRFELSRATDAHAALPNGATYRELPGPPIVEDEIIIVTETAKADDPPS